MKNGKYCILIADDEKEIRDILRLLLEGEGYAVLTAEDGREAIAEAADQLCFLHSQAGFFFGG